MITFSYCVVNISPEPSNLATLFQNVSTSPYGFRNMKRTLQFRFLHHAVTYLQNDIPPTVHRLLAVGQFTVIFFCQFRLGQVKLGQLKLGQVFFTAPKSKSPWNRHIPNLSRKFAPILYHARKFCTHKSLKLIYNYLIC